MRHRRRCLEAPFVPRNRQERRERAKKRARLSRSFVLVLSSFPSTHTSPLFSLIFLPSSLSHLHHALSPSPYFELSLQARNASLSLPPSLSPLLPSTRTRVCVCTTHLHRSPYSILNLNLFPRNRPIELLLHLHQIRVHLGFRNRQQRRERRESFSTNEGKPRGEVYQSFVRIYTREEGQRERDPLWFRLLLKDGF